MMEFKVLVLLFAFIDSALSQSISCNYGLRQNAQYMCNLQIQNPDGLNNFTQIEGFHFPGMNNVFVTAIVRNVTGSTTRNVPRILCSQFPHVTYMDLSLLGIEDVDEDAFARCRNLDWLRLYNNRIARLPDNLFIHNRHLNYFDLERNLLTTLPENLFANQLALEVLDVNNNPITNLPGGIFRNLFNLQNLYMRNLRVGAVNSRWFDNMFNLKHLDMSDNPISTEIPGNAFRGLFSLELIDLALCNIRTMNAQWFQTMANLHYVYMPYNQIDHIPSNPFVNSPSINHLDFGSNNINEISRMAFANMPNLLVLSLENNQISKLHPQWFENKPNLNSIYLDFNRIDSIPVGVFTPLTGLRSLSLWSNRIRTINRNAFGTMQNLWFLDLDENQINSVDERFLREARNLNYFYFYGNLCADQGFFNFANNINNFIRYFDSCIRNFGFVTERTTEAGSNYNFVLGMNPGMHLEVFTQLEARVALTGFNIVWNPMLEIVFANDTIRIVRNQDTDVAVIPTQRHFRIDAWNYYRITWARQVISVFEANEEFPFIAYTMQDWFPVNFLGLRAQESDAIWTLEPIQLPPPNQGLPNPYVTKESNLNLLRNERISTF